MAACTATVQTTEGAATISTANRRTHISDCYFIALLAFLVVAGSTVMGMYFSVAEDRMGDGFTAALYILAAGT
jgi:hypothetical protein